MYKKQNSGSTEKKNKEQERKVRFFSGQRNKHQK